MDILGLSPSCFLFYIASKEWLDFNKIKFMHFQNSRKNKQKQKQKQKQKIPPNKTTKIKKKNSKKSKKQ